MAEAKLKVEIVEGCVVRVMQVEATRPDPEDDTLTIRPSSTTFIRFNSKEELTDFRRQVEELRWPGEADRLPPSVALALIAIELKPAVWNPDTLDNIAQHVISAGYDIE